MKGSLGSLDANILLRLVLNDVADQHKMALRLVDGSDGHFEVADTAFIEVAFVLERDYKFARSEIQETIEGIISSPKINCNLNLFTKALPLFIAHRSLSFEDCCLAVYAEQNDAQPLWTFDQQLAKHAPQAKLLTV